jgi:WD40 repeat protein
LTGEADSLEESPTEAGRIDAFVTYARGGGGSLFVDRLVDDLAARGKTVWVDRQDIEAAAEWRTRIGRAIASAKALIFIVSPESAESAECQRELELAGDTGKLIVPVVFKHVNPELLPQPVADRNWIFLTEGDDRSAGLDQVVEALESDLEWRDRHTRLVVRAQEWDARGKDSSYLLRGLDLRHAEDWYAERTGHKEQPTELQASYIVASRRAASNRQRRTIVGVSMALVVSLILSVVAVVKSIQATNTARQSQSIAMAAESAKLMSTNLPLGILVAIEARNRAPTQQAIDALGTAASEPLVMAAQAQRSGYLNAVAFSPDGKTLVTGGDAGKLVVINRANGRMAKVSDGNSVYSVAFSPDGKSIATVNDSGAVKLFDVANLHSTTLDVGKPLYDASFNPDGSVLAGRVSVGNSAGNDIIMYNLRTGKTSLLTEAAPPQSPIVYSPDGSTLAWGGTNGRIFLHDLTTGIERTLTTADGSTADAVAFSPDGRSLASGDSGGQIDVFNLTTDRSTVFVDGSFVYSVAFSPDGSILASGDVDGLVSLYSLATGHVTRFNNGSEVGVVAFSANGKVLATTNATGGLLLYGLAGALSTTMNVKSALQSVVFSPNGKTLAASDNASEVVLEDLRTGGSTVISTPDIVTGTAVSPNGTELAMGDFSGRVILLNLLNHRELLLRKADGNEMMAPAFSPNGKLLAEGGFRGQSGHGQVILYHLGTSQTTVLKDHGPVDTVAISPNGKILASGDYDGRTILYELSSGHSKVLSLGDGSRVETVVFSPDGSALAICDDGGQVLLYNLRTHLVTTMNEGFAVYYLAFSPNGRFIASAGANDQVTVQNLTNGQSVDFAEQSASIGGLAFSPDGKLLANGDGSGTVTLRSSTLWTSSFNVLRTHLCDELGDKNMSRTEWATYVPDQPYRKTCP